MHELQRIVARCIVCRGDIYEHDVHEIWEDAYYCERHSLPHLRGRAQEYRKQLEQKATTTGAT